MKLSIMWKTLEYRGDHSTDLSVAIEYIPGETVEDLVRRVEMTSWADVIEIRIIRPKEMNKA